MRRTALSAALGLRAGDAGGLPPYLRVLAANARGLALLRDMEGRASLPVLTKPAHVRRLGADAERIFSLGAAAAGLCAAALRGLDWLSVNVEPEEDDDESLDWCA